MLNIQTMAPPMPRGLTKQILGTMRTGETRIVRPGHAPAFYAAARAMGAAITIKPCVRDGQHRFQIKRVDLVAAPAPFVHRRAA